MTIEDFTLLFAGLALFLLSISDIRKKKVPAWTLIVFIVTGICRQIIFVRDCQELMIAVLPGLTLLGVSKLSEEQIGYGDGLLALGLGMLLGSRNVLFVLCFAFIFSFFLAVVLLVSKKGNRKSRIPFFPCMFCGFLLHIMIAVL